MEKNLMISQANDSQLCSLSGSFNNSYQMDSALQNTLKRVSREIQVRKDGPKSSKQPLPPVYEMVGNSIAYQLLLQSHPDITVALINSTYPVLKNLQSSAQWLYDDYLELFNAALKKKATPQCLHPADIPTVKFLADLCVQSSSLPVEEDHSYVSPNPTLWMNLLAIFSASAQNQSCLVDYKCASKVVGCMNLTSMADEVKLQCHGWEVLSNIIQCSPRDKNKPAVHIQAITLLLSHIRRQCEQFYHDADLMKSILKFLSRLTSVTRASSLASDSESEALLAYSKGDSLEIIKLLEETSITKILLDLPNHLQEDLEFKTMLQSVLLSLAPVVTVQPPSLSPTTSVPTRITAVPPPKPKRSKIRSQYFQPGTDFKIGHRVPRKLPNIPVKRMSLSKSSEDLVDAANKSPVSKTKDLEYSIPAGIISHSTSRKSKKQTSSNDKHLDNEEKVDRPLSKPRPLSQNRVSSGPEQLTHYNRVSLKRSRGSYLKAVTASQRVHCKEADSVSALDIFAQVESQTGSIIQALADRRETISNIVELWKADKALQAASNLVMSCFFNDEADLPLFVDCLECFCTYPSQWSLGICIILLPYIRRIMSSNRQPRFFQIVNSSVMLMMKRFSVIILGIKKTKHSSRVHMEQRQACYHELHLLFATVTKLKMTSQHSNEVDGLIKVLKPFNEPLS